MDILPAAGAGKRYFFLSGVAPKLLSKPICANSLE